MTKRAGVLPIYRILFALLSPLFFFHTLWQAIQARSKTYLLESMGLYLQKTTSTTPIWLHAASVGEFNAALPLIKILHERQPQHPMVITTKTLTSAQLARRSLPDDIKHAFLPLDWKYATRGFLDHFTPRCALIMETELWPNLFAECNKRQIPILIINGRISNRTLRAPDWLRCQYKNTLSQVTQILARSEADKVNFISLGAPIKHIQIIGNIKFSAKFKNTSIDIEIPRPYVLAASTRESEEKLFWQAWQGIKTDHLLVIAPRHPKRLHQIVRDIGLPDNQIAIRSRGQKITSDTLLYIADTLGELTAFMEGAELVFMGGSLVPKGGQNMLEAARLGKAIVFGPYMDNFADEARMLLERNAAIQVENTSNLTDTLKTLLAQPQQCIQLGEAARQLIEENTDMAMRYADSLKYWCHPESAESSQF